MLLPDLDDGKYVIYRIQHRWRSTKGKWHFTSMNDHWCPRGFSSSSPCFKKTGVRGTYHLKLGVAALKWVRREVSSRREFRLVRITVEQTTTQVS